MRCNNPFNPNYALHHRLIDGAGRHLDPEDVSYAWAHTLRNWFRGPTDPRQLAAVGFAPDGTMIEMVAYDAGMYQDKGGNPLRVIYHANSATDKFLHEMGSVR